MSTLTANAINDVQRRVLNDSPLRSPYGFFAVLGYLTLMLNFCLLLIFLDIFIYSAGVSVCNKRKVRFVIISGSLC